MQLVDIPNDAPKIGDFYISRNNVVFEVDDIIYSQQEGGLDGIIVEHT